MFSSVCNYNNLEDFSSKVLLPQNYFSPQLSDSTFLETYLSWTPSLLSVLNIIGHMTGL